MLCFLFLMPEFNKTLYIPKEIMISLKFICVKQEKQLKKNIEDYKFK